MLWSNSQNVQKSVLQVNDGFPMTIHQQPRPRERPEQLPTCLALPLCALRWRMSVISIQSKAWTEDCLDQICLPMNHHFSSSNQNFSEYVSSRHFYKCSHFDQSLVLAGGCPLDCDEAQTRKRRELHLSSVVAIASRLGQGRWVIWVVPHLYLLRSNTGK